MMGDDFVWASFMLILAGVVVSMFFWMPGVLAANAYGNGREAAIAYGYKYAEECHEQAHHVDEGHNLLKWVEGCLSIVNEEEK